jgi:hypothetical protein
VRQITRRFLVLVALILLALLALGALPSYLGSGEPYYMTATPTDASGPAVNASALPADRYSYTTSALESGRSEGYQRGPLGLKESFTHSPFDELDALLTRQPEAAVGGSEERAVLVDHEGQRYRLTVERA